MWHHKVRTLLAVLSHAAGVFALGGIFGLIDQLIPNLNRIHRHTAGQPDHMMPHGRIIETTTYQLKELSPL